MTRKKNQHPLIYKKKGMAMWVDGKSKEALF